ncbi:MAG: hypothetical protein K5779_10540 [Saccharofermentans sp.]|nr:hypothetical protein [Saccharofermentans sp.]
MIERLKQYIVEVCCVYALISVTGAVINQIWGYETNNINAIVMFVLCMIGTFVLYLHKLFDNFSPLFMIIVQYIAACALCALFIWIMSLFFGPVSAYNWFEFWRSFTIPYVILAAFYYWRVFSEAKKQDKLIREIQEKSTKENQDPMI